MTSTMNETKDKTICTWIPKRKKQVALWSVIILIAVPLAVYGLSEISFLPVTGGNDWAGFWGGYIGAIIGGLITLFVMKYTIESENTRSKRQEKIQYFNDIIKISSEFFEAIAKLNSGIRIYMRKKTQQEYEKVLEAWNDGARISIVLELMLETRKSKYDLIIYHNQIVELSRRVNDATNKLIEVQNEYFEERKQMEVVLQLNEIMEEIEKAKEFLSDIVNKNLYEI